MQHLINKAKQYPIQDVFEAAGYPVNKGIAICPFHDDTNPSCFVNYKDTNCYKCHVCGEGGDVIDFTQKALHKTFHEAIHYLTGEFLKVTDDHKPQNLREFVVYWKHKEPILMSQLAHDDAWILLVVNYDIEEIKGSYYAPVVAQMQKQLRNLL